MNALINLKDCREYMTITLNNKDHRIKLSGTIDDPYFCGRNVCNILGYKNPKDAIQRYVEKEDKKDLKKHLMVLMNLTSWEEELIPTR